MFDYEMMKVKMTVNVIEEKRVSDTEEKREWIVAEQRNREEIK